VRESGVLFRKTERKALQATSRLGGGVEGGTSKAGIDEWIGQKKEGKKKVKLYKSRLREGKGRRGGERTDKWTTLRGRGERWCLSSGEGKGKEIGGERINFTTRA